MNSIQFHISRWHPPPLLDFSHSKTSVIGEDFWLWEKSRVKVTTRESDILLTRLRILPFFFSWKLLWRLRYMEQWKVDAGRVYTRSTDWFEQKKKKEIQLAIDLSDPSYIISISSSNFNIIVTRWMRIPSLGFNRVGLDGDYVVWIRIWTWTLGYKFTANEHAK